MKIMVRKKYRCVFEHINKKELIYVHYEDLDGYIHYECCDDPTNQLYKITPVQLINEYSMVN